MSIFVDGVYEKDSIQDFFTLMHSLAVDMSNSTIADIGANIGNHSIQFSKQFKRVIAFEPNPRTYQILRSNSLGINNIETHNHGCGTSTEVMTLSEDFKNIGASSAVLDSAKDNSVEIQIVPFDEMSSEIDKLEAIKIDVEGMELSVLQGSQKIIDRFKPIICLEQHESEFSSEFRETPSVDWLRERGFKIFALEEQKKSWCSRRLRNLYQLFDGVTEERRIIEYEELEKKTYNMIFAVHETRLSRLNLSA